MATRSSSACSRSEQGLPRDDGRIVRRSALLEIVVRKCVALSQILQMPGSSGAVFFCSARHLGDVLRAGIEDRVLPHSASPDRHENTHRTGRVSPKTPSPLPHFRSRLPARRCRAVFAMTFGARDPGLRLPSASVPRSLLLGSLHFWLTSATGHQFWALHRFPQFVPHRPHRP